MQKKTGPAAADVSDADGLKKQEKENNVLVVGYFKEFKVCAFKKRTYISTALRFCLEMRK